MWTKGTKKAFVILPCESCRERLLFTAAAGSVLVLGAEAAADVDAAIVDADCLAATTEEIPAACAVGGCAGLVDAVDGVAADAASAAVADDEDDDVALLAIANTADAIEGLPSPPLKSEPLDMVLAAEASAPGGLDGTSVLAPVAVCCSVLTSPSVSIGKGLHLSCNTKM